MAHVVGDGVMLNLRLVAEPGAKPHKLEYIDLVDETSRHRIKPYTGMTIAEAFPASFAAFVYSRLTRISMNTGVYTEPEIAIDLGDLVLKNLQVITSTDEGGTYETTFRFARIEGKIGSLLNDMTNRLSRERHDIAVEALEHVVGRSYNTAKASQVGRISEQHSASLSANILTIFQKRDELLFRLSLLHRAIDAYDQEPAELSEDPLVQIAASNS